VGLFELLKAEFKTTDSINPTGCKVVSYRTVFVIADLYTIPTELIKLIRILIIHNKTAL
jgi:hypothetical protein